ncbi:MAG: hypothetical protein AB7Q17_11340 [Phycisphaerae bacterium]
MRVLSAAGVYFLALLTIGFVLGPLRELVLRPRVGATAAVLIEAPVMIACIALLAPRIATRMLRPPATAARVAMGAAALALLLAAEVGLSFLLRGQTPAEYVARFATPDGLVGLTLFVVFAAAPAVAGIWERDAGRHNRPC